MKFSWRLLRHFVQAGMIILFLLPLAGCYQVIGTLSSSRILGITFTDPLAFLEVMLASKSLTFSFLLGALLIVFLYILLGKAFCSWICPVGFLIEGVDSLKKSWKKDDQKQYYWALPLCLILSFTLGIPVFQVVSPLGIIYRSLLFGVGLEILIFLFIVAMEFAGHKRGWCRILCPIGIFYTLMARWSPLKIHCDKEKCVKCLKCVKKCDYTSEGLKKTVLGTDEYFSSNLCTRCGRCIDVCPAKALQFSWKHRIPQENNRIDVSESGAISRRKVIEGAGILAVAGIIYPHSQALAAVTPGVLRPPGAVQKDEFLAKCIRCGKCIEICPDKTLLNAHLDQGLNLGTPYFIPRQTPCSLCMKCPEVCPTGALKPLDMREVKIGVAEIDKDRCYAYKGDVCRSCYNNCPLIDEAIQMESFQYPVINSQICTGCGICEYYCVTDPPAIQIKPLKDSPHVNLIG
ncbi:MAG: 4Fe-4S binding protein [Desulfitobacterium sp.]|nr:4Fe-4S binding protein [Desulfitobacterium sp.]MEA4902467.1 4Fe-4S binding protein [Desulfitobacterium sp.]